MFVEPEKIEKGSDFRVEYFQSFIWLRQADFGEIG